jgi:hypothetical protein
VGSAEADKTYNIGNSDARVFQEKIASVGAGNFAMIELFKAISEGKIKIVPDIMVSGNGQGGNGITDALIGQVLSKTLSVGTTSPQKPE